ncbi:glycosyl hydrolase family 18 protein [Fictibacillus barbaricus]|nr:glycosyl hydrolase family 18 protein [Fictibacillus barbaricus]GGB66286.1 hypothetical protein GCM10007199_35740 [Fictibacillus barbaricus]
MYRFVFIMAMMLLFVCQSKQTYGAGAISVGTVSVNKTSVLTSPHSYSKVVGTLSQSEAYPVLNSREAPEGKRIHTVSTGDTLYLVARHYGVRADELKKINHVIGSRLYVGQQLIIPQEFVNHTIQKTDSLWKIARAHHVSMESLINHNELNAIVLRPGTYLKIPEGYFLLQLLGNKTGWVQKSNLEVKNVNRFNLGWKYNGTRDMYQKQLHISGLDVVSPRWFTLSNKELVSIDEDKDYAAAAAKAGKQVWPLFGNKFDPELTDDVLSDLGNRQKVIQTIKTSLIQTKSQGINVDFENIDPKNKQDYVLFIQELKEALRPSGLVVSVDVSRENADPFWSGSLDRKGLGQAADYVIMMGYDEHWASSPKAGSVASLPWTRVGIQLLMNEVPAHKIILGVPFYTREWITDLNGKVRSIDRTIIETEKVVQEKGLTKKWDSETFQNYVEFTENGEKHQIWLEDETSLNLRYDLVKDYNLRGTAAWYVGGAPEEIWQNLK